MARARAGPASEGTAVLSNVRSRPCQPDRGGPPGRARLTGLGRSGAPGRCVRRGVTLAESTSISELLTEADQYDGQRVRVEGTVTEVCAMRGCWMSIASDRPFETLGFKVQDGEFTIPLEAKGRHAVAEGTLRKVALSPEDAQAMRDHEAEEQGLPVDNSLPLPTFSIKLEGSGAVIRDAS